MPDPILGGACGDAAGTNVAGHVGAPVPGNLDFQVTLSSPSAPVLAFVVGRPSALQFTIAE